MPGRQQDLVFALECLIAFLPDRGKDDDQQRCGGQHQESKTEVSIPIVFEHERKVVRGPNQAFNKAVSRCDTDRDGRITEQEARIYSQTVK